MLLNYDWFLLKFFFSNYQRCTQTCIRVTEPWVRLRVWVQVTSLKSESRVIQVESESESAGPSPSQQVRVRVSRPESESESFVIVTLVRVMENGTRVGLESKSGSRVIQVWVHPACKAWGQNTNGWATGNGWRICRCPVQCESLPGWKGTVLLRPIRSAAVSLIINPYSDMIHQVSVARTQMP